MSGEKSEKKKTGLELGFVFNFFRDFKAATGQQLWFLNSKMSTNSPEGHRFFGILMWIVTELSRKTMSLHSRVSAGVTFFDFERISPNLKEPKNAVVQAAQTVAFLSTVQSAFASSWPISLRRGRDMAFRDSFEIST